MNSTTQFPFSQTENIFCEDAIIAGENFNRVPFMMSHTLAEHPLFEIPRLVELAETVIQHDPRKVIAVASNISAGHKWSDMTPRDRVTEAIGKIEESGSLVVIKSAQLDPNFNILMHRIIAELEELTKVPLHREITWPETYIFISSPHSVTPYHIDHEPNFLFQIHGQKNISLFDPFDRSVLTEEEIEQYFSLDLEAATYKQENQSKAFEFSLTPGKVVHHPSLAPHWVQNGNNVSVSLSINFCLHSIDMSARVYQVNHLLRKLGIKPTSPGHSSISDWIKIAAIGLFAANKPQIKDDVVFSGILRLKNSLRRVKKILKK